VGELARANQLDPGAFLLSGSTVRVPATTTATATTYLVQPGDTLTALAARFGTTIEGLARANALEPAGILQAGATLTVPSATLPKASAQAAPANDNAVPILIDHWSSHYGVPLPLARAVAWMESGYQTGLVSPAGAWGVMQVMPATWSFAEEVLIGQPVNRDADGNVRVGVAYLHHLLHLYGGDERLALAAYYQGPRSVHEQGVLPASNLYIADVLALTSRFS
jgi:soluble lytic murein transglycosylase-like protein